MPALIAWWTRDVSALLPGASPEALHDAGADLLLRWREPQRRYHGTRHLVEMFWALEELGDVDVVDPREETLGRVAAWFHDAVYSVADPAGNEEASAAYASEVLGRLGLGPADVGTVVRLVRASARHELPAGDGLEAAFHDADLWILSADEPRFEEYCRQVREEYAAVPDEAYARGRTAVLQPFLDRERLYATEHADTHWTDAARANLERELSRLRS